MTLIRSVDRDGDIHPRPGRALLFLSTLLGATVITPPCAAQSIADQVRSIDDGQVRLAFAAREGVCSDGEGIRTRRRTRDWEGGCDDGPIRVALDVRDGRVTGLETYIGGSWRARAGVVDMETVSVSEATAFLLTLANEGQEAVAERAVMPAALADSIVIWPRLLEMARATTVPTDVRKAAVFWLGMAAGDAAADGLVDIAEAPDADAEVRQTALFSLSQIPGDAGVGALLRIAREHRDPHLRKLAIFWLGQTGDPRALDLFEEILSDI